MKNNSDLFKTILLMLLLIVHIIPTILFAQTYKTKYDTVDCKKYSANEHLYFDDNDLGNNVLSCYNLQLFLEGRLDELDNNIYSYVLSWTISELTCTIAHEQGSIPQLDEQKIYPNSKFAIQDTVYWDFYKYEKVAEWNDDQYISYKIILEKPQEQGYEHIKIGSGICSVIHKVTFIEPLDEEVTYGIGVYSGGNTPIISAKGMMQRYLDALESNYTSVKSIVYHILNEVVNEWSEEEKQSNLNSMQNAFYWYDGQCEEEYFAVSKDKPIKNDLIVEDDVAPSTELAKEEIIDEIEEGIEEDNQTTPNITNDQLNKLPVVNFDISPVSGGELMAPVWVKFYPSGTYDPDGYIVLFEIDMNGDGIYDVSEKTLTGGSYEFSSPGEYTASVRVTDEKGGITIKSKSFTISGGYTDQIITVPVHKEEIIYEKPSVAVINEFKDDEINKKLDSIIKEYREEDKAAETVDIEKTKETTYNKESTVKPTKEELIIEPAIEQNKVNKIEDNPKIVENKPLVNVEELEEFVEVPKVISDDSKIPLEADSYVYAYSYRNWNNANFGKHDIITTGWHSTGGEKRTYLKFDIPNVESENIVKATLKLNHHKTIGKNTSNISIYKVLEDWTEGNGIFHEGQAEPIDSSGTVIWNNQPAISDSIITQFQPKRKVNKWIEIDITPIIKEWINGEPNYGIVLKPDGNLSGREPTSLYEFYSKEYEDTSKIPFVEIQLK